MTISVLSFNQFKLGLKVGINGVLSGSSGVQRGTMGSRWVQWGPLRSSWLNCGEVGVKSGEVGSSGIKLGQKYSIGFNFKWSGVGPNNMIGDTGLCLPLKNMYMAHTCFVSAHF